jgi:hypothetical protein
MNAGPRNIAARRSIGVALCLALLVSMNGCYAFIPTTTAALPELTPVSVHLTLGGTVAMKDALGEGVNEVEGTVVRSSTDSLVVSVEKMYTITRQAFASSGTTAAIPRPYINDVKVRTFSRKRTVFMALGALAAAIALAAGVSAVASGDPGGGGTTPP